MLDPLFARAQRALAENASIRRQLRRLREEQEIARVELQRSVLESSMQRAEFRAMRVDREQGRLS